jgi:hypothetical protein
MHSEDACCVCERNKFFRTKKSVTVFGFLNRRRKHGILKLVNNKVINLRIS